MNLMNFRHADIKSIYWYCIFCTKQTGSIPNLMIPSCSVTSVITCSSILQTSESCRRPICSISCCNDTSEGSISSISAWGLLQHNGFKWPGMGCLSRHLKKRLETDFQWQTWGAVSRVWPGIPQMTSSSALLPKVVNARCPTHLNWPRFWMMYIYIYLVYSCIVCIANRYYTYTYQCGTDYDQISTVSIHVLYLIVVSTRSAITKVSSPLDPGLHSIVICFFCNGMDVQFLSSTGRPLSHGPFRYDQNRSMRCLWWMQMLRSSIARVHPPAPGVKKAWHFCRVFVYMQRCFFCNSPIYKFRE